MNPVLVEKKKNISILKINRPERMNALNLDTLNLLLKNLKEIEKDNDTKVLIVTGVGDKAFSTGIDLKEMPLDPEMNLSEYSRVLGKFQAITHGLRKLSIPVIAAVNGYAMGAGCGIALACDFRIASENAVFGETFVNWGFIPGDGGTYILPRLIGEAAAKDIMLTGRHVPAREALEIGLVEKVVPLNELMDCAIEKAHILLQKPSIAIKLTKQLINEAFDVSFEQTLKNATFAQKLSTESDEHKKLIQSFREKLSKK